MTRWLRAARGMPLDPATEPTQPTKAPGPRVVSVSSVLSPAPGPKGPPPTAPDLADLLDAAEERAAIIEHDGGFARAEAERLALTAVECPEVVQVLRARWGTAP